MVEWRVTSLSDLISLEYGASLPEEARTGSGFPVFGSNGVVGHHIEALAPGPGIIVGRKGSVGALQWSDRDFWPIDTAYWVRPIADIDLRWMREALRLAELRSLDSSTGVPGLNRDDAYMRVLHVPPLEEQRRIAEVLDSVDGAIRASERVIAKRRQVRTGLAFDLLHPTSDGLAPHALASRQDRSQAASLSDSKDPNRWRSVRVADLICHVASGPSPDCEERAADASEWGLLKTTAVTWSGWNADAHKVPPMKYWGNDALEVRDDDVIITKAGPRQRVGVVAHVPRTRPRLMVSGKMVLLRPDESRLTGSLLAELLATAAAQKFLDDRTTGMAEAQTNFTNESLLATPLLVPPLEEQRRIVQILDASDEAIRTEEGELEKLRQLRLGLAEDLLSGRVRTVAA